MPRQNTAERRQQSPISLTRPRTSRLTLEHLKLVAQKQDLDVLLALRAKAQHNQFEEPP
ncbi:MAG: hypothetical protein ACRD2Z_15330 [Thermoanaerobaculia bacterium]